MAGVGMNDIKRRIKSVNSTKQITKAMELVASSKLRKARERVEKSRPYFHAIKDTVHDIFSNASNLKHEFIKEREIKKSCFIVITSDRGLCGGYNSNAIKKAVKAMDGKEEVSVITIGQKARDFFRARQYDSDGEYTHISENPSFSDAKSISNLVISMYKKGIVDEVHIIYTQFVNTVTQNPEVIRLLPLTGEKKEEENEDFEYTEYDPSPSVVLNYLVPKYVESTIYGALVESSASEQGARRVAMESATDNAEEMIDDLTLKYNRARQAAITQEISEIVGGAEALQ
jgi:F-type H+-transporting ATPase subunit gamma